MDIQRNSRGHRAVVSLAVLLVLLRTLIAGDEARASDRNPRTEAYDRCSTEFIEADFFKPLEKDPGDLSFQLAPLILHETETKPADLFGALMITNGTLLIDLKRPTIYFDTDSVSFNGKPHVRFTYLWFYSSDATTTAAAPAQGIRLTLDSAGKPAIWEVLAQTGGLELVFVSHQLEALAEAEFGRPLAGCRHSIERGTNDAAQVVVPRAIDSGPVPMGPIVYLNARDKSATTVICRCMAAQAKKVRQTTSYKLVPWPSAGDAALFWRARSKTNDCLAFWPGENPATPRLERVLRLPREF
jgi:hypothetical protein